MSCYGELNTICSHGFCVDPFHWTLDTPGVALQRFGCYQQGECICAGARSCISEIFDLTVGGVTNVTQQETQPAAVDGKALACSKRCSNKAYRPDSTSSEGTPVQQYHSLDS